MPATAVVVCTFRIHVSVLDDVGVMDEIIDVFIVAITRFTTAVGINNIIATVSVYCLVVAILAAPSRNTTVLGIATKQHSNIVWCVCWCTYEFVIQALWPSV